MNIFYVHTDPTIAAQSLCDKHVVKMILESAQMLSTAHNIITPNRPAPYKSTHVNHPSNKWVRSASKHYTWLYRHFVSLCDEYTFRYSKTHKCEQYWTNLFIIPPIDAYYLTKFTPPPQCMPDDYKCDDTVQAYRNYYKYGKAHILKYTKRERPEWLK